MADLIRSQMSVWETPFSPSLMEHWLSQLVTKRTKNHARKHHKIEVRHVHIHLWAWKCESIKKFKSFVKFKVRVRCYPFSRKTDATWFDRCYNQRYPQHVFGAYGTPTGIIQYFFSSPDCAARKKQSNFWLFRHLWKPLTESEESSQKTFIGRESEKCMRNQKGVHASHHLLEN